MNNTYTGPTEADLEARIHAAMQRVFPWAPELRHQTRFEVTFGRSRFVIDGTRESVEGRSDIVLYRSEEPLAVLELKRPGSRLTQGDAAQGRSYALLLNAPLVIVSNGEDCQCFATHDMVQLSEGACDEQRLALTLASVSRAAKANLPDAVASLLGTDDRVWGQMISAITHSEIDELSGSWADTEHRFVRDFLVPRKLTGEVFDELKSGKSRAAIVVGAPLSGKSSILREIATHASERVEMDVLFIDCASAHEGQFRRIANILSTELAWPATPDDARNWLRHISHHHNRGLVIALDAPSDAGASMRQDIDELLSHGFGTEVKLVISLDDNDVQRWTRNKSGRDATKLGRFSQTFRIVPFDDEEFHVASLTLEGLGGRFVKGANKAQEFRSPWVLRTVAAIGLRDRPPSLVVVLPPLLGIDLFVYTAERLAQLTDLREPLRRLAVAYLRSLNGGRSHIRTLTSLYSFIVTESEAGEGLDRSDLRSLLRAGIVRRGVNADERSSLVVQQPEIFAHCVAEVLAERLRKAVVKRKEQLGDALTLCAHMPLGDIIGAQAILVAARRADDSLPLGLLYELLQRPPQRVKLPTGFHGKMHFPDIGILDLHVGQDGRAVVTAKGADHPPIIINEDDVGHTVSQLQPWLILARLCACRIFAVDTDGKWADAMPALLLEVASAPVIMRQYTPPFDELHVHDIDGQGEIACFHNGIVEPVTVSIAAWLSSSVTEDAERDVWIDEALARNSLLLINRIYAALSHLTSVQGIGEWANSTLANKIKPAMDQFSLH